MTPPLRPTLTERLRALVVDTCSEATLTCVFQPGGRLDGVGIRSHFYCARCGGSLLWHEIAEGLRLFVTAEDIIRAHGAVQSTAIEKEGRHG